KNKGKIMKRVHKITYTQENDYNCEFHLTKTNSYKQMKHGMKYLFYFTVVFLFTIVGFTGCSSEEIKESKSMEQIQKEEGIPVAVEKVSKKEFVKYLTYYGKFSGEKETIIGAMIGGRIEKINAKPGDFVKKNDVIIQFPEDSPASQYQQAQSAYENSEKTYERMKALHEKGEIAQAQFDGVETQYVVAKRNYQTMKDMLKLDAPYDGTITDIMVHVGDNVKDRTSLFTIATLNKMKIRVLLSDSERMQIKIGMEAIATVGGKSFTGKVSELSLSVNPMTKSFYADLVFDNSKREILAGTTADVKIITYKNDEAITISRNLLKDDNGKKYVFVANGDKAVKNYITISNDNGIDYEIKDGLKLDDSLIIKGIVRLIDGSKIKVVK
ncbi:MAG: efflux RND transporter periplasmic adaptor subunit, partial [Bacteroidetes bacterium]|nr:efflux RND transporter periplasmic adaptor subunit [Bacteroidota bacterium]